MTTGTTTTESFRCALCGSALGSQQICWLVDDNTGHRVACSACVDAHDMHDSARPLTHAALTRLLREAW